MDVMAVPNEMAVHRNWQQLEYRFSNRDGYVLDNGLNCRLLFKFLFLSNSVDFVFNTQSTM